MVAGTLIADLRAFGLVFHCGKAVHVCPSLARRRKKHEELSGEEDEPTSSLDRSKVSKHRSQNGKKAEHSPVIVFPLAVQFRLLAKCISAPSLQYKAKRVIASPL